MTLHFDVVLFHIELLESWESHHFLWNVGVMNFRKYLGTIFVTPPHLMIKNFMTPLPPSGATVLKKHVTPNARSAENMHFGGYFIEQNFH